MKTALLLATLTAVELLASAATAGTLDDVKARGMLNCGVNTGLVGFAAPDANGNWTGFDVSFCRALAAAVLGDPKKVNFLPTTGDNAFPMLKAAKVDLLERNSTWTFTREVDLKLTFVGVNYYDGQGFLVPKKLGVSSAKELGGATICLQPGTSNEVNLADYFKSHNMTYTLVPIRDDTEGKQKFLAKACDAYTTDVSALASMRATLENPQDYVILPEVISKAPSGPVVRQDDPQWASVVRWTLYALIGAEEFGITSANLEELSKGTDNPEINRLLGSDDNFGALLGLDKDWAKRAIAAGGNYGEIFEATIGSSTPIGLARGLNAQWTKGGLMYAIPFH
jgi:general L-amino acid transport system substrate-binding protein